MLGILDWGIGGLGFYSRLKEAHPEIRTIYLSDSGSTPYGELGRNQLRERVAGAIGVLASHGVNRVVVACNAASTVVPLVRKNVGVEVIGIIEPAVEMVRGSGVGDLGIVGGARTIRSGVYHRHLADAGIRVRGRVAQPLSAMIEAGAWKGKEFTNTLEQILRPLRGCEGLLLACTHYPAAIEQFRELMPSSLLIDPVDQLLVHALRSWDVASSIGDDVFMTTGNVEVMRRAARLAFGVVVAATFCRG